MKIFLTSAALFASLLIGGSAGRVRAQASDATEPTPLLSGDTTRGLALGTGARASAASTSSLVYNPASLPLGRGYHVEGAFGYEPQLRRYTGTAAIVDSTTIVAAGLQFSWLNGDGDEGHSGFDTRLALGLPLGEHVGLGVSGRYIKVEADGDSGELVEGFTLDAALRVSPVEDFHLAALAYNLVDLESAYAPRMLGGSVSLGLFDELTIGGDCLVNISSQDQDGAKLLIGGGVEYLAAASVPLRLGYSFDQTRDLHQITAGVGYVDQNVGLDISLRQGAVGGDDTTLLAAFRYFVR